MTPACPSSRDPAAGVTLIEMMIALALFALIGSAGFAMLDQVLRSQRNSEGRLERLSEQQRAMHVILADFAMAEPRSLQTANRAVSFDRNSSSGSLHMGYRLDGGVLRRSLSGPGGAALADQAILGGIESLSWRFLTPDGRWSETWPADGVPSLAIPQNPRAVELLLSLQSRAGTLRRVAALPADLE